jgi:hypothetical protein
VRGLLRHFSHTSARAFHPGGNVPSTRIVHSPAVLPECPRLDCDPHNGSEPDLVRARLVTVDKVTRHVLDGGGPSIRPACGAQRLVGGGYAGERVSARGNCGKEQAEGSPSPPLHNKHPSHTSLPAHALPRCWCQPVPCCTDTDVSGGGRRGQ